MFGDPVFNASVQARCSHALARRRERQNTARVRGPCSSERALLHLAPRGFDTEAQNRSRLIARSLRAQWRRSCSQRGAPADCAYVLESRPRMQRKGDAGARRPGRRGRVPGCPGLLPAAGRDAGAHAACAAVRRAARACSLRDAFGGRLPREARARRRRHGCRQAVVVLLCDRPVRSPARPLTRSHLQLEWPEVSQNGCSSACSLCLPALARLRRAGFAGPPGLLPACPIANAPFSATST